VRALLAASLMISACDGTADSYEETPADEANLSVPVAENVGNATPPPADAAAPVPADDPGLADMSPSRRRAYEAGLRDCRAGRYDPDPYPEAYRIGCGAAEERKAAGAGRQAPALPSPPLRD